MTTCRRWLCCCCSALCRGFLCALPVVAASCRGERPDKQSSASRSRSRSRSSSSSPAASPSAKASTASPPHHHLLLKAHSPPLSLVLLSSSSWWLPLSSLPQKASACYPWQLQKPQAHKPPSPCTAFYVKSRAACQHIFTNHNLNSTQLPPFSSRPIITRRSRTNAATVH